MPGPGPWAQAKLLFLMDSDEGRLVCGRGQRLDRVTWMEKHSSKQRESEKAREIRKKWWGAGSSMGALDLPLGSMVLSGSPLWNGEGAESHA